MTVVGGLYIGILAGTQTTVQLRAPVEMRARVLSIYLVSLGGIFPIGGVVQGWLGDRVGLGNVTAVACALMIACMGVIAIARPSTLRALGDPVPGEITSAIEVEEPVGLVAEAEAGIA